MGRSRPVFPLTARSTTALRACRVILLVCPAVLLSESALGPGGVDTTEDAPSLPRGV